MFNRLRDEVDILYGISNRLTQASSAYEWLEAVSAYARENGAQSGQLYWLSIDTEGEFLEIAAEWVNAGIRTPGVGTQFRGEERRDLLKRWMQSPNRPILITDMQHSDMISRETRQLAVDFKVQSSAVLPLNNNGNWVGMLMFTWGEAFHFDERDQRIYTAIIQQAAPIIDSMRLLEETRLRAEELERARAEQTILFDNSQRLMQASNPQEIVEAIITYARNQNVCTAVMYYVHPSEDPTDSEYMAVWVREGYVIPDAPFQLGMRVPIPAADRAFVATQRTGYVEYVENITTSDDVKLEQRGKRNFTDAGMHSFVMLCLNFANRWLGVVYFMWDAPRQFTDVDRRIYSAIMRQTAPVVYSLRLLEEARQRAHEIGRAKHEIHNLYNLSNQITRAHTPDEVLEVVSQYPRMSGASNSGLIYLTVNEAENRRLEGEIVAEWAVNERLAHGVGRRWDNYGTADDLSTMAWWLDDVNTPTLIENTAEEPRFPEAIRRNFVESEALSVAVLPLNNGGRWVGILVFSWNFHYHFTEQDQRIFTALIQQSTPVIDSLRLLEKTRSAFVSEQEAREESQILYHSGEAINAANTFDEVLSAVEAFELSERHMALAIFENHDLLRAESFEIVAGRGDLVHFMGRPHFIRDYPYLRAMPIDGLTIIEDIVNDPRVDEVSRVQWLKNGAKARVSVPLVVNGRWMGHLAFFSKEARSYSARDRRLIEGVGNLASAAVERIRLREQTEKARVRAERLFRVNTALSQAICEENMVNAIAEYWTDDGPTGSIELHFVDADDMSEPPLVTYKAIYGDGKFYTTEDDERLGHTLRMARDGGLWEIWFANPEEPTLVEDVEQDTRVSEDGRKGFARYGNRAAAVLPLFSGGRWQGIVMLRWRKPHVFTEDEKDAFRALLQPIASIVASRRAYLAEQQAREESELLFRASEAINAAHSFAEIVQAVDRFRLDDHHVALPIWENYDYEKATYFEIAAAAGRPAQQVGDRYRKESFPISRTLSRAKIYYSEDIEHDANIDPVSRESWMRLGTRARIGVPLVLNGRWMGTLTFVCDHPRVYTLSERRLVEGVGSLVTAAVERIRLRDETERDRERAERLLQINTALSQATDENSILEALAPLATPTEQTWMSLYYLDADSANVPISGQAMAHWTKGALEVAHPHLGQVFQSSHFQLMSLWGATPNDVTIIDDYATHPALSPPLRQLFEESRTRSLVLLPLMSSGRWQGIVSIGWEQPHSFSADERYIYTNLLQTLPSVIASRRAYLAQEAARRENEYLYRASKLINAANTVDEIAQALCKMRSAQQRVSLWIFENYSFDEASHIDLLGLNEQTMEVIRIRQTTRDLPHLKIMPRFGLVIIEDMRTDEDLDDVSRQTLLDYGVGALINVGMSIDERWLGGIAWTSASPYNFTAEEHRLAHGLGDLVAAALDRVRLREASEAARQRAELYAERAHAHAALEERNRIARELHDSVSQALFGIVLGTRTARAQLDRDPNKLREPLDYILTLADAGLTEMRALIFELRPEALENEGLAVALQKQAQAMQARYHITMHAELNEEPSIPIEYKDTLYRIAREALHNIIKHAKAQNVWIGLERLGSMIQLTIRDDGVGFDPDGAFPGHLGLKSMRERAMRLGGAYTISSQPNEGTLVDVQLPYIADTD
jgi:signal transduction histidine kinase/putative methionine-R-sulfoxide reductase with GAF domain